MKTQLSLILTCLIALCRGQSFDDWSWVKNFAAVGDSFTAGIGAGTLWDQSDDSTSCSRYDGSYPAIMNRIMGGVQNFYYPACSGDTSDKIMTQIQNLPSGLDLVVMTAGGNDLCLSNIIYQCILKGTGTESSCQATISNALSVANNALAGNIQALLQAIDAKMNKNGIVVLVEYAQYFNADTSSCASETWSWPRIGPGLPLSTSHRSQFNSLVTTVNGILENAAKGTSMSNAKLVTANWDAWAPLTGGQFCENGASPKPWDSSNNNVMFYKLDTSPPTLEQYYTNPIKARGTGNVTFDDLFAEEDPFLAAELLAVADGKDDIVEPWELVVHKRGITAPNCPHGFVQNVVASILPDDIGKIFHPNELGHQVIASFAMDQIRGARAEILGISGPGCAVNQLACAGSTGSHAYATGSVVFSNAQDFCSGVEGSPPGTNGIASKTYNSGTPDEHTFQLSLSGGASTLKQGDCLTAMSAIIQCDLMGSTGANNPLNWVQGGTYVQGSYHYSISIARTNRPWPYPTVPTQSCAGWYKFFFDAYDIYGAGWSSWDYGQQTLLPSNKACFGLGVTNWHFEYFDQPDENGYEWHAWFNSPIWTRARCFNNNKVQQSASNTNSIGGGCKGNG